MTYSDRVFQISQGAFRSVTSFDSLALLSKQWDRYKSPTCPTLSASFPLIVSPFRLLSSKEGSWVHGKSTECEFRYLIQSLPH